MDDVVQTPYAATATGAQDFWSGLDPPQWIATRAAMRARRVTRGETLIERGAVAETLYVVNFGLFEVLGADGRVMAEIGANELIGEIGFFADEPRTASVVAARDSEVAGISRAEFEALCERLPEVRRAVARSLAQRLLARLAPLTPRLEPPALGGRMRIITLVGAGAPAPQSGFVEDLRSSLAKFGRTRVLAAADVPDDIALADDRHAWASWLGGLERAYDVVICVAEAGVTDWTQAALRSADQLLLVAGDSPTPPNAVEMLAFSMIPRERRRLARVHPRSRVAEASAAWLSGRDVFMIHHVAAGAASDFDRLARFLAGCASGYVAGGAGAFGPAHIGIVEAFRAQGVEFDIFGGSGVGAAMAAALATGMTREEIDAGVREIFVQGKALKKIARPRYGLLDHSALDEALRRIFGVATMIEDVWKPYFAVTTDLSTFTTRVERSGPLWEAVRASSAIPGVLPPFFDRDGHMLVDGGVVDNAPLATMKSLKAGANVVVDLRPPARRFDDFSYQAIPGRLELLARAALAPAARRPLPRCPSPAAVIQRSLYSNSRVASLAEPGRDLVLRPPAFLGAHFMRWDRCDEVVAAARAWAKAALDDLAARDDSAFALLRRRADGDGQT
jgi:NTE family protein